MNLLLTTITSPTNTTSSNKVLYIVLGAILLAAALFLIIAILLQSSKSKGLSGTISGGAETFFGKNKGKSIDKKLSILTTIVAIVFIVLVLVVYVSLPYQDQNAYWWDQIIGSFTVS